MRTALGLLVLIAAAPADERAPAPRPAGGRLAVGGVDGSVRLLSADGAELAKVAAADVPAAGGKLRPAGRVRPDGAVPVRTGDGLGLLTAGRGATLRPLADRGEWVVAWSPDGRRPLVRLAGDPPTYSVREADGTTTPVTLPAGHTPHDWADDGWFLTTTATGGDLLSAVLGGKRKYGIWLVWADGRRPERLAPEGVEAFAPRLSPDGRRVAYFTDASPHMVQLWTLDLRTGERVTVRYLGDTSDPTAHHVAPRLAWAPDGRRLAVSWQKAAETVVTAAGVQRLRGAFYLFTCGLDGGDLRWLRSTDDPADGVSLIDWR